MKVIAPILTSLIVGILAGASAILSVQNATPISLKFLNYQSIQLPIGVILAFSFAVGAIVASILVGILFSKDSKKQQQSEQHGDV
jgi:uncharacterized integral membrane protein